MFLLKLDWHAEMLYNRVLTMAVGRMSDSDGNLVVRHWENYF